MSPDLNLDPGLGGGVPSKVVGSWGKLLATVVWPGSGKKKIVVERSRFRVNKLSGIRLVHRLVIDTGSAFQAVLDAFPILVFVSDQLYY